LQPDEFLVTADGTDVAARYAGRWSIQTAFRDVKQHVGHPDPRS
jgi:hypothetical protein